TPDLLRAQHRRNEALALGVAAVMDQRGRHHLDPDEVRERRRICARELLLEDHALDDRATLPSELARPVQPPIAAAAEPALEASADLDESVRVVGRVAQLGAPRSLEVRFEPTAELAAKGPLGVAESQIQAFLPYSNAPSRRGSRPRTPHLIWYSII